MNKYPRTDEAYDRAEATVQKHRRADLHDQATIDELDKACRELENDLSSKRSEIQWLRTALEPFAKFACDEPHVGEPMCHNCIAKAALAPASSGKGEG